MTPTIPAVTIPRTDGRMPPMECAGVASIKEALEHRAREVGYADYMDLRNANLRRAQLSGLSLNDCDLRGALLDGTRLNYCELRNCDLRGLDLRQTFCYGMRVESCRLDGLMIDWNDHSQVAMLLREAAGVDVDRRMVAGLILVSPDWCYGTWYRYIQERPALGRWALAVLYRYMYASCGAPAYIQEMAGEAARAEEAAEAV